MVGEKLMEEKYWLALSMIKGVGPVRISKLLDAFGSPRKIWEAPKNNLKKVAGIGNTAAKISEQRNKINPDTVLKILKKKNIKFIPLMDDNYPHRLKNIYDPPPVLYYRGNPESLKQPSVAIVGSRRCTKYGRKTAKKLGYELAHKGIVVVSGMARGIDTRGHLGALETAGKTIAVLGSGLDVIYPPENRKLFHKIRNQGTVISEFPPGVQPVGENFPRRNRIISGLSLGIIVVEAAKRSGSLITANLALEQGREVFAVPGNIDRTGSKGTNNLIKNGAKIVTSTDDILEELFFPGGEPEETDEKVQQKMRFPELSDGEEQVFKLLQQEGTLHVNNIIEQTGLESGNVNSILLKLELKDLISHEPGKKYAFKGLQNLLKPI
ncbi:MAG: DNA-processing protein DprA [Halanaerobiales bacterium]